MVGARADRPGSRRPRAAHAVGDLPRDPARRARRVQAGGRLRIHETDLEAWLESTQVTRGGRRRPAAPSFRPARPPVQLAATADGSRGRACGRGDAADSGLSVHRETARRRHRRLHRVRWREGGRGSVNRRRTFDSEDDARDFDRRVRRLKQTGDPALLADEITLREYVHGEWWPNYAERRLALSTQESHSIDLDLRILPRLGDLTADAAPPERRRALRRRPRTRRHRPRHDRQHARRAAGRHEARGPRLQPARQPGQADRQALAAARARARAGHRRAGRGDAAWCLRRDDLRSATLISLLAYAGPRPESEALPLRWAAIRRRTILFRATKRGVPAERATRLLAPLADDLRAWREACGHPPDDAPVIPNARGEPWAEHDWDNWRGRNVPRGRRGRRAARRQGGRRAPRAPARSALELRDAADLRGPAAASTSPSNSATAPRRCCATTHASGRTSTRRSASAPRRRSTRFEAKSTAEIRLAPHPLPRTDGDVHTWKQQRAVRARCLGRLLRLVQGAVVRSRPPPR